MVKQITCECGFVARAGSGDAVVEQIRSQEENQGWSDR